MSKLGNRELARMLVEKYEIERAEAERFVSLFFDVISDGLRKDKQVKVKGLGTFKVTAVASRKSVDVNTGESIVIEGRDKIVFTADKAMADEVNRPFAQFDTVLINDGVSFDEIDQRYAQQEEQESEAPAETTVEPQEEPAAEPIAEESVAESVVEEPATESIAEEPVAEPVADLIAEESVAEPIAEESESESVIEEPAKSSAPLTFSISSDQLLILNETPKGRSEASEASTSEASEALAKEELTVAEEEQSTAKEEQDAQEETPVVADEAAGVAEDAPDAEFSRQTYMVAQAKVDQLRGYNKDLQQIIKSQRTSLRWTWAICVLLLVVSISAVAYLGHIVSRRDHRIQHLEAQMNERMPVILSEGSVAVARADSIQASEDSIEAETTRQLAASAKEEKQKAEALAAAQREAQLQEAKAQQEARQQKLEQQKQLEEKARKAEEAKQAKAAAEAKAKQEQQAKAAAETKAKQAQQAKAATEAKSAQANYNKDVRIRYGAYTIVGIDHTVTVRAGQTLASISKSQLGPGMECYIEAVNNGRTTFKAGEKINIPKLKLKKK